MSEDNERLKDLVTYIACSLVDDPDAVDVRAVDEDRQVVLELMVGEGDLGKIIGKEGRTARAMRTLLTATSARMQKRALLDILE